MRYILEKRLYTRIRIAIDAENPSEARKKAKQISYSEYKIGEIRFSNTTLYKAKTTSQRDKEIKELLSQELNEIK